MFKPDLDRIDYIITHPDNIEILKKELDKNKNDYIYHPKDIEIIAVNYLPKEEQVKENGKIVWQRTKVLSDSSFIDWVTDMENPSSWQIYFGLVEPKMQLVFYAIKKPLSTVFKPKTEY